jgi:hypothetical protein
MIDPKKAYTFNHLIALSDPQHSQILENNISGQGANICRALRSDSSALNNGITWKFPNAVAAVNAFMLKGNHDNYTGVAENTQRWNVLKSQLQSKGGTVSMEELKQIVCFCPNHIPGTKNQGSIYRESAQQIILCEPASDELEIFFRPRNGQLPSLPVFEEVPLMFDRQNKKL